jgi:chromosomal replication initiation ATPase DnaA
MNRALPCIADLLPLKGGEFVDAVNLRVANLHGVPVEEMKTRLRRRRVAHARFAAWFLIYQTGRFSLVRLGHLYGGRDHTSICHGIARFRTAQTQEAA